MEQTNNTNQSVNNQNNNQKEKKKKNKKTIFMIVLMVAVTALALYYILKDDPIQTLQSLMQAKVGYILLMILIVIITFCIEGVVLTILSKLYYKKYRVYQGILNGMVGSFFSCITPFSSGGQFAQVYTFSRQGIKSSNSASILVMLFIVSQTVIILYGALAMIFGYNSTILKMSDMDIFGWKITPMVFSIIGFIINIFSLLILLLLAYLKPLHRFILTTGINIGAKLHLIKDPVRKRSELAANVATFRIELTRLFKNGWILLITLVLEFLKFTFTYSLPYIAGLALSADVSVEGYLSLDTYARCLWSSSYQSMITGFIPIPGASGVAEGSFQLLFSSIYNPDFSNPSITSAANILNRAISFYFSLFAGFIVFVSYRGSPKKTAGIYDLQKTFVDLKIISLANQNEGQELVLKEVESEKEVLLDEKMPKGKVSSKIKKSFRNVVYDKQTSEKENMQYITVEQLESSFAEIKKYLTDDPQEDNIFTDSSNTNLQAKEALSSVYKEMEDIEKNLNESKKVDTEISLAVQKDLDAIVQQEKRREEKRKNSMFRRLFRKNKKDNSSSSKEEK